MAAVLLEAENDVAATLPNFTPVAPVRLVPTIDTWVPPLAGPWFGLIAVMVGRQHVGKGHVAVVGAAGVLTRIVTEPVPAGVTALTLVLLRTVNDERILSAELHVTDAGEIGAGDDDGGAAGSRTGCRADRGDRRRTEEGIEAVRIIVGLAFAGGDANRGAALRVAGVIAVISVSLTNVTLVRRDALNVTPVTPVKRVPVIVTVVPPAVVPTLGWTEVTVGCK